MKQRLTVPAVLTVTALSLGSLRCGSTTSPPAPSDVSAVDATLDAPSDVASDTPVDTCPDPFTCYSEIVPDGDGGFHLAYIRRDGGVSDVACPPTPDGCLVV
ncbi:MAG: hypothetical protein U0326_44020 [Polyangiales bacterium]